MLRHHGLSVVTTRSAAVLMEILMLLLRGSVVRWVRLRVWPAHRRHCVDVRALDGVNGINLLDPGGTWNM